MAQITLTNHQTALNQSLVSTHEYELNQSESVDFCFNLIRDISSNLSNAEIVEIFASFQERESSLPFSFNDLLETDIQGLKWPSPEVKHKFNLDRVRIGNSIGEYSKGWFCNIPNSRARVRNSVNLSAYKTQTNFFEFSKFYSRLKLDIIHFQLRNLVCCGQDITKGIYYPLIYFRDSQFQIQPTSIFRERELDPDMYHQFFKINRLSPDTRAMTTLREPMMLDCMVDSHTLSRDYSGSKVSTLTCSGNMLVCGTFEGGYILIDTSAELDQKNIIGEHTIANRVDGITNHLFLKEQQNELCVASNDKCIRLVDLGKSSGHKAKIKKTYELPFLVNCLAVNRANPNELLFTGDDINSYIMDTRQDHANIKNSLSLEGHQDYGFSCDWSPTNENLLVTGNQDGSIKLWDKRKLGENSVYTWDSSLGRSFVEGSGDSVRGGPVRNTKFSSTGEYISWAESLDHVGVIQTQDLLGDSSNGLNRVQSIDFVGKCIGISFAPIENERGEELIIGVNDKPLGGILNYRLGSKTKSLDFDFHF